MFGLTSGYFTQAVHYVLLDMLNVVTDILQDDKEGEFMFSFDRVFYEASEQADIYKFLAQPIVRGMLLEKLNFYCCYW